LELSACRDRYLPATSAAQQSRDQALLDCAPYRQPGAQTASMDTLEADLIAIPRPLHGRSGVFRILSAIALCLARQFCGGARASITLHVPNNPTIAALLAYSILPQHP